MCPRATLISLGWQSTDLQCAEGNASQGVIKGSLGCLYIDIGAQKGNLKQITNSTASLLCSSRGDLHNIHHIAHLQESCLRSVKEWTEQRDCDVLYSWQCSGVSVILKWPSPWFCVSQESLHPQSDKLFWAEIHLY